MTALSATTWVPLGGPPGEVRRISPDGTQTTMVSYPGGPGVAGLTADAAGNIYYALPFHSTDPGVYRLDKKGNTERLPGTENIALPNGIGFDKKGNLYVGDSILGAVWRIPDGGEAEFWFQDALLEGCGFTPGWPPVGANGVAYRQGNLYVASTEKGLLVRIPVMNDGSAGEPEIIAGDDDCDPASDYLDSIDGIALDVHGNIYALLVMQHKLVRIDAKTGDVTVIADGEDGFFNPASLAFGTGKSTRKTLFIANFALIPPGPEGNFGPSVLKLNVGVAGQPLP